MVNFLFQVDSGVGRGIGPAVTVKFDGSLTSAVSYGFCWPFRGFTPRFPHSALSNQTEHSTNWRLSRVLQGVQRGEEGSFIFIFLI